MVLRISTLFLLFVSLFYMPFWLSIILAFGAMIYFSFFWEGVILLFISDLLYGVKEERFFNVFFVSFIISFLVLIIIELLKKKIRISD